MRLALPLLFTAAACASTAPSRPPTHLVSATVLVNRCSSLGAANAKLAQKAMLQLTDGCSSFSGGTVRFTATLLPGGAIQFEPRPDQADSVPICVLSHPLTHQVHLKKSCSLDVELDEKAMVLPRAADAGPR